MTMNTTEPMARIYDVIIIHKHTKNGGAASRCIAVIVKIACYVVSK